MRRQLGQSFDGSTQSRVIHTSEADLASSRSCGSPVLALATCRRVPMSGMKLGIFQSAGTPGDVDANLEVMVEAIAEAASDNIELLVFPEGFLTGYYLPDLRPALVPDTRSAVNKLCAAAVKHEIAVVFGLLESARGQCFNSAIAIGQDGKVVDRYVKRALFGEWERESFANGKSFTLFEYLGFRIGMLICYDVEFPELVRELTLNGANLIVVPTALMEPYTPIAEYLIPTRALENQIFVAYANRCGTENGLSYVGRSAICGPDGNFLAKAAPDTPEILTAHLHTSCIRDAKSEAGYLEDLKLQF